MNTGSRLIFFVLVCLTLAVSACGGASPKSERKDQDNYSISLFRIWGRQEGAGLIMERP